MEFSHKHQLLYCTWYCMSYTRWGIPCYAAPPLLEFGPRTGAEGGEGPARARMENRDRFNVMYYPTWCSLKKIAPMGNRFFEFISKMRLTILTTLCWLLVGVRPSLLPWVVCLGKFVFWSCGPSKLYIRVRLIFFVTSLCFRVCLGANSGCSFLFQRCSKNGVARRAKRGNAVCESAMFAVI